MGLSTTKITTREQLVSDTNPLPVTLAAPVGTSTVAFTGTATITRAANTTAYSIGDVVGGAITIANAGPSGGDVIVNGVRLLWNITALPAGMTTYTLYLYNVTPPSAIADNSPFTLGSGDRSAFIGKISGVPVSLTGVGTSSVFGSLEAFLGQFKLVGSTSLFAYLVTDSAYTPAANSETGLLTTKGIIP